MGEISEVSGIKVLDRAVAIMIAAANQPSNLNELVEQTGLPRATAHRLATALEAHRILVRREDGRWIGGPALPGNRDHIINAARPIMDALKDDTGESVQLYMLTGNSRTCVATAEPTSGLHNVVPVGSELPLHSGSAARIIAAFAKDNGAFAQNDLSQIRDRFWAESIEEREVGLASVSAPVLDDNGHFIAAISISGPAERFRPHPGEKWGERLVEAAREIATALNK